MHLARQLVHLLAAAWPAGSCPKASMSNRMPPLSRSPSKQQSEVRSQVCNSSTCQWIFSRQENISETSKTCIEQGSLSICLQKLGQPAHTQSLHELLDVFFVMKSFTAAARIRSQVYNSSTCEWTFSRQENISETSSNAMPQSSLSIVF